MSLSDAASPPVRRRPWLLGVGALLIALGVALAAFVQTAGGVKVSDVRWTAPDGTRLSALLYRPPNATERTPAPGILAIHGYINSREMQSAFAIEFARRGWVVLALDQRGHGFSGGAATQKGYGAPEGLAYLRALPFVDRARVGMEGHSMGGFAAVAAARLVPDDYAAMVLEGSTTARIGARRTPGAAPPPAPPPLRNVAVVFSRFDEFGPLMWGVPKSALAGTGAAMRTLFGTPDPVRPGRLYGDVAAGTARIYQAPPVTHPGDHISTRAVGHALDWFGRTLGGSPRPPSDQIWPWHELGTGLALVGLVPFLLGVFDLLLAAPPFAGLRGTPTAARERRGAAWWALLALSALLAPLIYFLLNMNAPGPLPLSAAFPQRITNSLLVWAAINIGVALLLSVALRQRGVGLPAPWGPAMGAALVTAAAGYAVLQLAGLLHVDFRFWVVALKPLAAHHAVPFLTALIPFTLFVAASLRAVSGLTVRGEGAASQYLTAVAALAGGFLLLTGAQYLWLFATGGLPFPAEALDVIVAIQFVPVLAAVACIHVFTWRRTGGYVTGALLCGLLVTWYVVAGTATHLA